MKTILLIVLVLLVILYRPRGVWRDFQRVWDKRDYFLKVMVFAVGIYLLYGLYSMYQRGMIDWW